jgi:hypothetical protein
MQFVRWNPIRDIFSLRNRINHMFDDFLPIHRGADSMNAFKRNSGPSTRLRK